MTSSHPFKDHRVPFSFSFRDQHQVVGSHEAQHHAQSPTSPRHPSRLSHFSRKIFAIQSCARVGSHDKCACDRLRSTRLERLWSLVSQSRPRFRFPARHSSRPIANESKLSVPLHATSWWGLRGCLRYKSLRFHYS